MPLRIPDPQDSDPSRPQDRQTKQDEAHEPECRHVRICWNMTETVTANKQVFFIKSDAPQQQTRRQRQKHLARWKTYKNLFEDL